MTKKDQGEILRAVARLTKKQLHTKNDDTASSVRDEIAIALAPSLGMEGEQALIRMQALAMVFDIGE